LIERAVCFVEVFMLVSVVFVFEFRFGDVRPQLQRACQREEPQRSST
jgi:hypothetical protein